MAEAQDGKDGDTMMRFFYMRYVAIRHVLSDLKMIDSWDTLKLRWWGGLYWGVIHWDWRMEAKAKRKAERMAKL